MLLAGVFPFGPASSDAPLVSWFAPREAIQHEENGGRDDCGAGRQIAGEYPG